MATTGPEDPGWRPNLNLFRRHHLMPWTVLSKSKPDVRPTTLPDDEAA
jgi:hypothetical protein